MKHFVGLVFARHWLKVASLLMCAPAFCQDIAVGTWRTHFSYADVRLLESTTDKVFCAAENGFFSRDLVTGETRKLSKIDGLSDVGITAMAYGTDENVLVLGYESGIIDLIYEDKIVGLTNIANSNLDREKQINDIAIAGSRGYIASEFGVVVVDFDQEEIAENFLQIGEGGEDVIAEEVVIQNDSLFILTEEGIQVGILSDNLLDFNNWTRYPETIDFSNLVVTSEGIFTSDASDLFRFQGGVWIDTGIDLPAGSDRLIEVNRRLFTISDGTIYAFDGRAFEVILNSAATQINDLSFDNDAQFLIADSFAGLLDINGNSLSPDGPVTDEFSRIRVVGSNVFGFNAPSAISYDGTQQVVSYSLFSEGIWSEESIEGFTNVSDVASFNGLTYFTSIGAGLYIEGVGIQKDIPTSSSALDTLLTGMSAGESLYLTAHSEEPLHVLDASENWISYSSSQTFGGAFNDVMVSELGTVWLLSAAGTISILDTNENTSDLINTGDGLPSSVLDFDISIEDDVWVATSQGPASFGDASFIFSDTEAFLPTFDGRVLFEEEQINAVLTDGGNRVWFGTNRGLWVFDENTSNLEAFFDAANSPLPSDIVLNLAYNGQNGEVFVVTDKGMVSYRSASSVGTPTHSNVRIFPNPVRPDFQGQVGITGLANDAILKVTDVNGNLVKEIRANGGSASWDLLNVNGSQVVTGIYYFFSSTFDGEETFVGKIAVVR